MTMKPFRERPVPPRRDSTEPAFVRRPTTMMLWGRRHYHTPTPAFSARILLGCLQSSSRGKIKRIDWLMEGKGTGQWYREPFKDKQKDRGWLWLFPI